MVRATRSRTTKDHGPPAGFHPFVPKMRNKKTEKGILLFYMDSCPGLAVVTFISLLINAAIAFRWYTTRKSDTPNPLLQTQYHESLVENGGDEATGIVSI